MSAVVDGIDLRDLAIALKIAWEDEQKRHKRVKETIAAMRVLELSLENKFWAARGLPPRDWW